MAKSAERRCGVAEPGHGVVGGREAARSERGGGVLGEGKQCAQERGKKHRGPEHLGQALPGDKATGN